MPAVLLDLPALTSSLRAFVSTLYHHREYRLLSLVVNQDRFLFIAVATLLNLAEEPSVQRKMVKKDVVGLLLGLMSRPHLEVLLLVVGFLRRLCVYVVSEQPSGRLEGLHEGCGLFI